LNNNHLHVDLDSGSVDYDICVPSSVSAEVLPQSQCPMLSHLLVGKCCSSAAKPCYHARGLVNYAASVFLATILWSSSHVNKQPFCHVLSSFGDTFTEPTTERWHG